MKHNKLMKLLKTKRIEESISQKELGDTIGTHAQYISNFERGLAPISIPHLKMICKKMGIKKETIKKAMLDDYETHLDGVL